MSEIILQNKNGEILASSREVAEKFGKRHDKLTSEIKRMYSGLIGTPQNGGHPFFIESEYENEQNHQFYTEYLMNRDGFSLLVMGFTGKKALEWKLKYINAFNTMEEKLKSGSYLSEEEKLKLQLFSKNSLEVASAHNRLLELATAPLIEENKHKQEVINGLTDDVPLYKKPDIINRICKRSYGGYADRYKELYKCFKENFHVDLVRQCENYNDKQEKKKNRLSIIRYAEKFGYTDNLYVCCAKLYESEVNSILEEINEVHK